MSIFKLHYPSINKVFQVPDKELSNTTVKKSTTKKRVLTLTIILHAHYQYIYIYINKNNIICDRKINLETIQYTKNINKNILSSFV